MVEATPLPPDSGVRPSLKLIARRAIEAAGSQQDVADDCGVTRQRVAQWMSTEHDAVPNLRHMVDGPVAFAAMIATELLALRDRHEAVLQATELAGAGMQLGALIGAVLIEANALSIEGPRPSRERVESYLAAVRAVGEQARKIERGLRAALEAAEKGTGK